MLYLTYNIGKGVLFVGFMFRGLYVGSECIERDGKQRFYVLLSAGASAFRFSVTADVFGSCGAHQLGDVITLSGVTANAFNGRVYHSATAAVWEEV